MEYCNNAQIKNTNEEICKILGISVSDIQLPSNQELEIKFETLYKEISFDEEIEQIYAFWGFVRGYLTALHTKK
jgi:hypothetical protein